ncbi:MAG TPA: deoxyhypusine synthase family protein [Thermoanaerobaculia bacterium]|nr:deoxyhypusine synthase family protein [Thermoanaerobaculia bacterium]
MKNPDPEKPEGFEPLELLDLGTTESLAELLSRMSKTAFGGRELGKAYGIMRDILSDPNCTIVVTISGAMTIAKMGLILCEMIDNNMADIIVSTGAILTHALSEAIGGSHYKHHPSISDEQLYELSYNRIYDTLEPDENLARNEEFVSEILNEVDWSTPLSSVELNRLIGKRLTELSWTRNFIAAAFRKKVPIYIPAFTDSELGLTLSSHCLRKTFTQDGQAGPHLLLSTAPSFNPYLDLHDYTRRIMEAERLAIFTIGGGVPRNWAQQAVPFGEMIRDNINIDRDLPKFLYGIRICPEPVHWGGMSGCSYSEGISWGKFVSPEQGGKFAEVHCDATIAWPILIRATLESRNLARLRHLSSPLNR